MENLSIQLIAGQVLIGTINGSFYALLALGLAIIFGMLNIVNFMQGALYMLGAFFAYILGQAFGINYWGALVLCPILVGLVGIVLERVFFRTIYDLDPVYGLLLTFGLAIIVEGIFRIIYGSAGIPYSIPDSLKGAFNLGFVVVPYYRAWVVLVSLVVCIGTWIAIEKTPIGARLRAATENPGAVRTFGINVPLMITLTYGFGVGLAGLAGVMAAPIYSVSPQMGGSILIVTFAVVVIGGLGSIAGAIVAGYGLGILEGLTKVFFPEASSTVVFVAMAIILLVRPKGMFGRMA
jgi:branched-chain amino acid transport system permease protein